MLEAMQSRYDTANVFHRAYNTAQGLPADEVAVFEAWALLRLACTRWVRSDVIADRLLDCAEGTFAAA